MKVGDLVKMDFENDDEFHPDEWGVGVIVEIDGEDPMDCDNVHVLWAEVGLSWEMLAMLEKVDEAR